MEAFMLPSQACISLACYEAEQAARPDTFRANTGLLECMSRESAQQSCQNDMHKNKDLKRHESIWEFASRFRKEVRS